MANIPHLIDANQRRWNAMHFNTDKIGEFAAASKRLIAPAAKPRYLKISEGSRDKVPWAVVAVAHERESTQNFNAQLAQGDPLNEVSTHVPRGQGPYLNHPNDPPGEDAFYRAALVALNSRPVWHDWSAGGALTYLEQYNGLGYADMGRASPYIWSGTSEAQIGKYDHDGPSGWNPNEWDVQLGCAGLLRYMSGLDPSIKFPPTTAVPGPVVVPPPIVVPTPVPVPVPAPVPVPVPTPIGNQMGSLIPVLLQVVLGSPALMSMVTGLISNPAAAAAITQVITGLSTQVAAGATPQQAITNMILTQYDLDQAAAVVQAEMAKLGLPPLTLDQAREMAALVVRNYITNTKAGK